MGTHNSARWVIRVQALVAPGGEKARARLTRLVQEAHLELLQDLEDLREMREAKTEYSPTGDNKRGEVVKGLKGRR